MTFTEAAAQVLRLIGKPLHYKEITDVAIEKNLLSHVGKSPEVTMGARLAALVKKDDKDAPVVRVKPGVFALRDWDADTIAKGLQDRTPALERLAAAMQAAGEVLIDSEDEGAAADAVQAALLNPESGDSDTEPVPVASEDDRRRAELAAGATDLFEAEEDDDEPIFGEAEVADGEEEDSSPDRDGNVRRRRRRRKRGRGEDARGGDDLPGYTVSEAPSEVLDAADTEVRSREHRGSRDGRDDAVGSSPRQDSREPAPAAGRARPGPRTDDSLAKDLADVLVQLLASYDKNGGSVTLSRLADAAKRRGRLTVDGTLGQALLESAARIDNLARVAGGLRPRFRLGDRRVALCDWYLDAELLRFERDISGLIERHRDHVRRAVLRRLQESSQRALGEVIILLLERIGFTDLQPVRRPGTHGAELHLAGKLVGPSGEARAAVVVRRDGREIGRERVTELRGALHHYGPAHVAWLVTTGQVLSGARDEAGAPGATPVTLLDGLGLARLMEDQGIGVLKTTLTLPFPDVELLDALKSGN